MTLEVDEVFAQEGCEDPVFAEVYNYREPLRAIRTSLLDARAEKNWSQRKLAKESGVTQATISKIEQGEKAPTVQTLMELAKALGKRVEITIK